MLQSIEKDDFKEGVSIGKVIRADEMDNLLGSFFNPIKKQKRDLYPTPWYREVIPSSKKSNCGRKKYLPTNQD